MDAARLDTIRAELAEEQAAVERQLAEHGVVEGGIEMDVAEGFADSAQATTERAEVISHIEQLQAQRREIVEALARLESGTYGRCERCGQPIPRERLEAIPTARLCVRCKQIGSF